MSADTGHRTQDKINTVAIVVIGIAGAVLTYVSISLLQAFYMNDTAQVQTMADYGGQDTQAKSVKSAGITAINTPAKNGNGYVIKIDKAMELVVEDAQKDPSALVPLAGKSDKATVYPKYGRPVTTNLPPPDGVALPPAAPAPVDPNAPVTPGTTAPADPKAANAGTPAAATAPAAPAASATAPAGGNGN